MRKWLVFAVFLLVAFVQNASATTIGGCANLNTADNVYLLTADISNSASSPCFNVNNNNITLDCQNHAVDGIGSGYGVYTYYRYNFTLRNCVFTDWNIAVYGEGYGGHSYTNIIVRNSNYAFNSDELSGSVFDGWDIKNIETVGISFGAGFSSNSLRNIAIQNTSFGIYLSGAWNFNLTNVYIDTCRHIISSPHSGTGIDYQEFYSFPLVHEVINTTFDNVTITNCYVGIHALDGSRYNNGHNTLKNSRITDSGLVGIQIDGTDKDYFYNNYFSNTVNIMGCAFPSSGLNFNIALTPGTNIVGGPNIGGNYWGSPTGTGFSDTCNSTLVEGICDDIYSSGGGICTDYFPLGHFSLPPAPSQPQLNCNVINIPPSSEPGMIIIKLVSYAINFMFCFPTVFMIVILIVLCISVWLWVKRKGH